MNDPYDTRLPFHLNPVQKASKDFCFLEADRPTRELISSRERTALDRESSLTAEYNAGKADEREKWVKKEEKWKEKEEKLIKEKTEMVRKMLSSSLSAEQISQFTSLSIDEIKALQN